MIWDGERKVRGVGKAVSFGFLWEEYDIRVFNVFKRSDHLLWKCCKIMKKITELHLS